MSSSPTEAAATPDEAYRAGWAALNKLLRRGYSWSGHERNCAFLNTGDGFADVSFTSGLDVSDDGRAAAVVDWDHDGDLDLFLTARNGPRVRFLQNGLDAEGHLSLKLVRPDSANRDAIGARVEVLAQADDEAPVRLLRTRRAGEGYLAQSSGWLHFGLGERAIESVTVRWPGGAVETFAGVERDGRYVIVEGRAEALPWEVPAPPALASSGVHREEDGHGEHGMGGARRIVLTEPVPMPSFGFVDDEGESRRVFGVGPGGEGRARRPVLVNLLASWCAPCRVELGELHERGDELAAAGLTVLALGADAEDEAAAVRALLEELEWRWPSGVVAPATLALFEGLVGSLLDREDPLSVPTSLLCDDRGRVIVVYVGPVEVDQLLADLRLVGAAGDARLAAAVPFPGRWRGGPPHRGSALIEARLRSRGLAAAADELALSEVEVVRTSRAEMLHSMGMRAAQRGDIASAVDAFQKAIAADPKYFPAYRDLGIAMHREGRFAPAVDLYRQALHLQPEAHKTRFDLGLALLSLGERSAAESEERRLREAASPYADELARQIARLDQMGER